MGIRIALAGNPNCGKTTMFNDLTGANQYVGNWPGVTVEKKEGKYTKDKDVTVTDLPGIYSLSPYSPEEIVARDYLLDGDPDVVINLIDATNLERNLYLTTQILELGLPVVIALNMMDLVEKNGDKIDVDKLSRELGCPIVPTSALKGRGMDELVKTAIELGKKGVPAAPQIRFSDEIETALAKIIDVLGSRISPATARWFAIKVLEGEERTISQLKLTDADKKTVDAIRDALETELDDDAESIVTSARYDEIAGVVDDTVKKSTKGMSTTQKIDRVVTNRFLGLPIFIVIMFFVYWLAVSVGGGVVTDWANDGISGDGWLYTGGEAFDEATAEYEDAQAQITAYVENILGEDEVSDLPSDDARKCSMRLPWPSLRLPKTPLTSMLWPSTKTPLPSTTMPRPRLRRSTRRPRPSMLLPRWKSKATTARSRSRRSPSLTTRLPSKSKSPTPPMALGACGFRVSALSSATPLRRPTLPRGCSRSSWTVSSQVLAPLSASSRRW